MHPEFEPGAGGEYEQKRLLIGPIFFSVDLHFYPGVSQQSVRYVRTRVPATIYYLFPIFPP